MTHRTAWREVMDDPDAAAALSLLESLEGWGYVGGYDEGGRATKDLLGRGLIAKCWDWPAEDDHFNLTPTGCTMLRTMWLKYDMPQPYEPAIPRPFYGRLDGVCGLSGEENRTLLYLRTRAYMIHCPNLHDVLKQLVEKRLALQQQLTLGSGRVIRWDRHYERTLEGKVVLRHILRVLGWKEEALHRLCVAAGRK